MRKHLIITGSPRAAGVSAAFSRKLRGALLGDDDACVCEWSVAAHEVAGCVGCEACRDDYACVMDDDMAELLDLMDRADVLHVVCPVYFAGAPSQFKAVLDRLQPLWEKRRGPNALPGAAEAPKKPVTLYVIGAGGDPFGFEPLVTTVRSAFGAAGYRVEDVVDLVGWNGQSTSLTSHDSEDCS